MKSHALVAVTLAALASGIFLLTSSLTLAQGTLTPPGPPAPSMKTLDQVDAKLEKRTPISAAPFIIATSGSYYLTQNLTTGSGDAITINAAGVTVDLNGFTLSSNAAGTGTGVAINGDGCTIRHGRITNFASGIKGGTYTGSTIEGISCDTCSAAGLSVGLAGLIQACRVSNVEGQFGISALDGSTVLDSTVTGCTLVYGLKMAISGAVSRCTVLSNSITEAALEAGLGTSVTNCAVTLNSNFGSRIIGIHGLGTNVVTGCLARRTLSLGPTDATSGVGIWVQADSTVRGCDATGNSGDGIRIESHSNISDCVATNNGTGAFGSGIAAGDDNDGIRILIRRCLATGNAAHGITIVGDCVVRDCVASDNGKGGSGAGIIKISGSRNRIEGNEIHDNKGSGIFASAFDVVIHNTAGQNTPNYNTAGNTYCGSVQLPSNANNPFANIEND
jgi:parallel beta-helix repeat protein